MIKIEAIVREDKLEDVKEALSKIQIHGITVYQVMGCGIRRGFTEIIRGNKIEINMLPKIKFEIILKIKKNKKNKSLKVFKKQLLLVAQEMVKLLVMKSSMLLELERDKQIKKQLCKKRDVFLINTSFKR